MDYRHVQLQVLTGSSASFAAWPSACDELVSPVLCLHTSQQEEHLHPNIFQYKPPPDASSLTGMIREPCILLIAACAILRLGSLTNAQPI